MDTRLYEAVMGLYMPQARYLKSVEIDFPRSQGIFDIGKGLYTAAPIQHLTAIEVQVCLNQLLFYVFGEWITSGRLSCELSLDEYTSLMRENMFIIDSVIGFREKISTDKPILGTVELKQHKQMRHTYFAFVDYSIEDDKSSGSLKLALRLPEEK